MSLSLEGILPVKQKANLESRKAGPAMGLRSLWLYMDTLQNPNLQIVFYSGLGAADKVIADVACKLYALFSVKPTASTTSSWLKGSDHATVAAANGDIVQKMVGTGGGGRSYCLVWHDGLPLATGLTLGAHTTVSGNTKSNAADAPTGFAIIGAA
jgi:hypothetical protein